LLSSAAAKAGIVKLGVPVVVGHRSGGADGKVKDQG
jgi:hypothetical protein